MHAIRSKARHAAWYTDEGPNWNPWGRARTARRLSDEEIANGSETPTPRRIHSEACVISQTEKERRSVNDMEQRDISGLQHASTEPHSSKPSSPPKGKPSSAENHFGGTGASDNVGENGDGMPRKRNGFGLTGKETAGGPVEEPIEEVEKKPKPEHKITAGSMIKVVLLGSWINLLLFAVPAGFAVHYTGVNGVTVFVVNFIAIVPLAALLSYATEEIALRVGETLGGLLNATFGNAVELIVSIQALVKNEITIVKTSLIGSMLSNLLLVLGMSFFLGGLNRLEQHFNVTVAQTAASLLALCIGSLIVPTVFLNWSATDLSDEERLNLEHRADELSRGTAIILLVVYACYLFFQLKSHVEMYNAPSPKAGKRKQAGVEEGDALRSLARIGAGASATAGGQINQSDLVVVEEEKEEPQLTMLGALVTLAISTTLVAFCSEFMVDSINDVTESGSVSKTFVGLILLPIVGNAAEHATAVTVAIKDKMDLSIGVAVGSSMQIALLVLPLAVVIGWIINKDCMTLFFDGFQIAVLFVSVLLVNYLIQDGKSHWLEGVLLIATYLIIAVAGWFYPNTSESCKLQPGNPPL